MASKPDIQLIAFDLGGVLLNINKNVNQKFFANNRFDLFTKGVISTSEYFADISRQTGKSILELQHEFEGMVSACADSERLLLSLTRPFTFWSNINVCHFEHILNQCPGFRAYDSPTSGLSFSLGLKKPDKKFFETCLQASGLEPASILFLDDTMSNVVAARSQGIRADCVSHRSLISKLNGESLFP